MENILNRTFTFGTKKYTVVSELVSSVENPNNYSLVHLIGTRGGRRMAARRHNGALILL